MCPPRLIRGHRQQLKPQFSRSSKWAYDYKYAVLSLLTLSLASAPQTQLLATTRYYPDSLLQLSVCETCTLGQSVPRHFNGEYTVKAPFTVVRVPGLETPKVTVQGQGQSASVVRTEVAFLKDNILHTEVQIR